MVEPADWKTIRTAGKSDNHVLTSSSTSWFTLLPRELRLEINSLVLHYKKGPLNTLHSAEANIITEDRFDIGLTSTVP